MTKENHCKATQILEQIDELERLSEKIGFEYKKSINKELKELLNKCNQVVSVLKEINQEKFKAL